MNILMRYVITFGCLLTINNVYATVAATDSDIEAANVRMYNQQEAGTNDDYSLSLGADEATPLVANYDYVEYMNYKYDYMYVAGKGSRATYPRDYDDDDDATLQRNEAMDNGYTPNEDNVGGVDAIGELEDDTSDSYVDYSTISVEPYAQIKTW